MAKSRSAQESKSEENILNFADDLVRRRAVRLHRSKFNEYFEQGIFTDVNIVCQDYRTFRCHRIVLAAASKYFDENFKNNHTGELVLRDIDSKTFKQILVYVYRGEVAAIDEANVYNLLRASDILELSDIEYHCVHYLTQKNIPMDSALEIYLYASTSNKVSLIAPTSQFILQHLDHFSRESLFSDMSVENLSTLLSFFQASSASREVEERLLEVILHWVGRFTNVTENRRSSFLELAQNVQFRFVSAEYVSEYFDKNFVSIDGASRRCEALDLPSNSSPEVDESLYVYVRTEVQVPASLVDDGVLSQTRIFSPRESGEGSIEWNDTHHTITPAFQMVRTVESAGQLYSLSYDTAWSFSRCTSIDLSTDSQTLETPSGLFSTNPPVDFDDYDFVSSSLCCIQKNIYLNLLRPVDIGFQCYHTELDTWTAVPAVSEKYEPKIVMNDGTRLYIVGNEPNKGPHYYLAAYDPRVGKVDELSDGGELLDLEGICKQPGCFHKGRMYVPEDKFRDGFLSDDPRMAIYDPSAGRWNVENLERNDSNYVFGRRLLSFNNRLWMFGFGIRHVFAHTYDSYLRQWSILNPTMNDEETNVSFLAFADVIAFKSL